MVLDAQFLYIGFGDSSVITRNSNTPMEKAGFPKGILFGFHSSYVYEGNGIDLECGEKDCPEAKGYLNCAFARFPCAYGIVIIYKNGNLFMYFVNLHV